MTFSVSMPIFLKEKKNTTMNEAIPALLSASEQTILKSPDAIANPNMSFFKFDSVLALSFLPQFCFPLLAFSPVFSNPPRFTVYFYFLRTSTSTTFTPPKRTCRVVYVHESISFCLFFDIFSILRQQLETSIPIAFLDWRKSSIAGRHQSMMTLFPIINIQASLCRYAATRLQCQKMRSTFVRFSLLDSFSVRVIFVFI